MSRKTGPSPTTVVLVLARSDDTCEVCGVAAGQQIHHRRPRGMGGTRREDSNAPSALLYLCAPCHHGEVESKRDWAIVHGWLVGQAQDPALVPVLHARHGWVRLTDDGGVTPC